MHAAKLKYPNPGLPPVQDIHRQLKPPLRSSQLKVAPNRGWFSSLNCNLKSWFAVTARTARDGSARNSGASGVLYLHDVVFRSSSCTDRLFSSRADELRTRAATFISQG